METLMLGQIDNAAAPSAAAAELYYLSAGYGNPVGTDTPLLVETDDQAPAGQGGRFLLRRALVPLRHGATCAIRSTVITDFVRHESAVTTTFASHETEEEDVVEVPVARAITMARVRIEVTARSGKVVLFTPSLTGKPMTSGAPMVVEGG